MRLYHKIQAMVLAILIMATPIAGIAAEYRTIQQLREETPSRWTQTYEAHGRTIEVDAPILLPEVNTFPILRVTYAPDELTEELFHEINPEATLYPDFSPYSYTFFRTDSDMALPWYGLSDYLEGMDARADGNPMSAQEARAFGESLIKQLEPLCGPIALQLRGAVSTTRGYQNAAPNPGTPDVMNKSAPVSEYGCYYMRFHQSLHGIPLLFSNYYSIANGKHDPQFPWGVIELLIYSRENYSVQNCSLVKETGIAAEDVPLCSFAQAKKQLERQIAAGTLWRVDRVQLGYRLLCDQNDPNHSYYLVPVWEAVGEIQDGPNSRDVEHDEDYLYMMSQIGSSDFYAVNAQTGELIDKFSRAKDRYTFEKLLTWEDVHEGTKR
ncbi:MAG: hypothetical protein RR521_04480 [Clostridia bacterium]